MMQSLSSDDLKKEVLNVVEPCLSGQVAFTAKDIVNKVRQNVGKFTFVGYSDVSSILKELNLKDHDFMISQIEVFDDNDKPLQANLYHHNLDLWDLESAYPKEFRKEKAVKFSDHPASHVDIKSLDELDFAKVVDETQDELPEKLKTTSELWDELVASNCFFA